jgi:hypothetical protein
MRYFVYIRYLNQCQIVFPYTNKRDDPIMATGKNHSIIHTPGDVTRYCDAINISCDPPEEAHKTWVKEQGLCTNQGPQVQLSMMLHSLHKEASSLLCEAVQGINLKTCIFCILHNIRHIVYYCVYFAYFAYFAYLHILIIHYDDTQLCSSNRRWR